MRLKLTLPVLLVLLFTACTPAAPATPLPATEVVADAPMPVPGLTDAPTEMVVTELATYTDAEYGFSFDYPKEWMLDVVTLGERAPHSIQLTSWQHEPGQISEVQEGGTVMNIIVQLWDPKGDLAAFVQQRMDAWSASGLTVISQGDLTLEDGRTAQEFVIGSSEGESYFLLTVLGDQYLVISGSGDIATVRDVAHSLR